MNEKGLIEVASMNERGLTEIADLHGTDKGTVGPVDSWPGNNYTDIYSAYLDGVRQSTRSVLEIGLGVTGECWESFIMQGRNAGGGGSLKTWHDFFPNAMIYGIDVNPAPHLDGERARTFVADQGNVEDLRRFMDTVGDCEFDLIIDDGSHRPDHQQITLGFFFKRLKAGGLYVIEDLMNNGLGDATEGDRHACAKVRNTRRVLKTFRETGQFGAPNTLLDPDYLAEHIEHISFHSPGFAVKLRLNRSFSHPLRKVVQFRPGSERLCVIRKRPAPIY